MDIPKQPAQPVHASSVSLKSAAHREGLIADIDALKLQAGKQYPARVVMSPQSQSPAPSSSSNPPPTSADQSSPVENRGATEKATTAGTMHGTATETKVDIAKLLHNEYLIRINAKTILITSEKQLSVGDKLFLSLDPNMSSGRPSLIARMVEQQNPQAMTQPASALVSGSAVQSGSALQNNALLNSQQVNQLLQALNMTLDKQIPLQEGLRHLISLLPTTPLTGNSTGAQTHTTQAALTGTMPDLQIKIEPHLRQQVQQQLISVLSRSTDILNSQAAEALSKPDQSQQIKNPTENQATSQGTLSSNAASGVIKTALLNSGLFLESALLNQPEKLVAFKSQLESLHNNLQQTNKQMNELTAGNSATLQRLGNSLNKIQQTIEHLIQNMPKPLAGTSTAHASLTPGESNPVLSDLKASLVSLAAQASRQLARETSAEALKNLFLLPVAEDYALSPFAFPLLTATKASSARSLFEKQEFTTGQLLKLLAGMIHRLQFNQLHSLLQSNSNTDSAPVQQSWFFELPVINPQQQINTFNFRIDKESQTGSQQTAEEEKAIQWKLLLSFDLEHLGPIYVQVKFLEHVAAATPSISSVLWADKAETLNLMQNEAEQFRKSLENLGLKVTELRCEQGQPNQTRTRLDRHLVDTRA